MQNCFGACFGVCLISPPGLLLFAPNSQASQNIMLKIGIVGMGSIGNTHADCYVNDSLATLVAVCDFVKEEADAAAKRRPQHETCDHFS
jgi:ubiquitin C-terminal hydrolase